MNAHIYKLWTQWKEYILYMFMFNKNRSYMIKANIYRWRNTFPGVNVNLPVHLRPWCLKLLMDTDDFKQPLKDGRTFWWLTSRPGSVTTTSKTSYLGPFVTSSEKGTSAFLNNSTSLPFSYCQIRCSCVCVCVCVCVSSVEELFYLILTRP